jgi:hypothetical protein
MTTTFGCNRCKTPYCGVEHQTSDWPAHSAGCNRIKLFKNVLKIDDPDNNWEDELTLPQAVKERIAEDPSDYLAITIANSSNHLFTMEPQIEFFNEDAENLHNMTSRYYNINIINKLKKQILEFYTPLSSNIVELFCVIFYRTNVKYDYSIESDDLIIALQALMFAEVAWDYLHENEAFIRSRSNNNFIIFRAAVADLILKIRYEINKHEMVHEKAEENNRRANMNGGRRRHTRRR